MIIIIIINITETHLIFLLIHFMLIEQFSVVFKKNGHVFGNCDNTHIL